MAISLLLLAKRRATAPYPSFAEGRYGYGQAPGHRILSAGLALGIAGGVATALALALVIPEMEERLGVPIITRNIEIPRPVNPDVEPVVERPATPTETRITVPQPRIEFPPLGNPPVGEPELTYVPPPGPVIGTGDSGGGTIILRDPPPAAPVWRAATRDPRSARSFQPAYPPALEREGVIGIARVRVRISAAGEVISVENLESTHPDFFAATQRQALRHWRFRPATRDGVAVESEQVLTVRFEVPERD